MNYTTRYLRSAALIFCSLFVFFHGCPFTKKHDVRKIAISENKVGGANVNDPAVWMNPFSVLSPAHREFSEYRQWVLNNEKLAAASDMGRPTDRLMLSGQLAAKGFARLPTDSLEQHLPLVGKMLASLDTRTCSKFIKKGIPDSEFTAYAYPVMESFTDAEAKAWFLVNRSAIEAQLDGSRLIVLSTEDAKQGILKIAKSMYEPQSRAFISA